MAHQLVLLIDLIGLLFVDLFLMADLSITQNVPASMTPGSEVRVTVTVNKGDLTGFAKLQLDLPPGLSATAIETKGASFTFADQKAKFIWMSLPASPTFKLSYTLTADATASGPLTIQGRLSYIENNERKTYDLPPSTVDLGAPGAVPVAQSTIPDEEDPAAQDLVSAAGGAPVGAVPVAVIDQAYGTPPMQGAGGVSGARVITPVTEKEMMVEVTVKKGDIRGFGKLQETIPAGFTAVEHKSDEAIFTAQDRIVKFVWLNLPARQEVKVTYKLRANERPEGEYSIDGEFGYLLNDETQKAVVGTSKFFVGPKALEQLKAVAQEVTPAKPVEQPDGQVAQKPREQPRTEPVKQAPPVRTAPEPRVTGPEKGIMYKVQITAAHREVGRPYFKARHRYSGDFNIERHQGWIKFVTGRFGSYQEARDHRVSLVNAGHQFPGPFVTAYNNGERITVQEALMISGQKWIQ